MSVKNSTKNLYAKVPKRPLALALLILVMVFGVFVVAYLKDSDRREAKANAQHAREFFDKHKRDRAVLSENAESTIATNSVRIINFSYSPKNITVTKGTTVTWTNNDGVSHDVVESDNQPGPKSPELSQGQVYSYTFNTPGTYKYTSSKSGALQGTVTVTE
jgi:plastocyanin